MEAEFAREVLTRLPLAEAVLSLWRWVADPLRPEALRYSRCASCGMSQSPEFPQFPDTCKSQ